MGLDGIFSRSSVRKFRVTSVWQPRTVNWGTCGAAANKTGSKWQQFGESQFSSWLWWICFGISLAATRQSGGSNWKQWRCRRRQRWSRWQQQNPSKMQKQPVLSKNQRARHGLWNTAQLWIGVARIECLTKMMRTTIPPPVHRLGAHHRLWHPPQCRLRSRQSTVDTFNFGAPFGQRWVCRLAGVTPRHSPALRPLPLSALRPEAAGGSEPPPSMPPGPPSHAGYRHSTETWTLNVGCLRT